MYSQATVKKPAWNAEQITWWACIALLGSIVALVLLFGKPVKHSYTGEGSYKGLPASAYKMDLKSL